MKVSRQVCPNGIPLIIDAVKEDPEAVLPDRVNAYPVVDVEGELMIGSRLPLDMDDLKPHINLD
jgi:hypothetical protein|tara:strand:+ start:1024 stop:1215 length:192 start_codon:yes stop_codon:yes gene_type:complete